MSKTNQGALNYSETTFFGFTKISGVSTILNWSIVWALLFTTIYVILLSYCGDFSESTHRIIPILNTTILASSASAMGVIIAALSVTIALFSKSLLPKLLQSKLLHKFLFPFWYAVLLWGITVFLSLFVSVTQQISLLTASTVIFTVSFFLFIYSIFFTINLTGQVIRLTLQNAQDMNND